MQFFNKPPSPSKVDAKKQDNEESDAEAASEDEESAPQAQGYDDEADEFESPKGRTAKPTTKAGQGKDRQSKKRSRTATGKDHQKANSRGKGSKAARTCN